MDITIAGSMNALSSLTTS